MFQPMCLFNLIWFDLFRRKYSPQVQEEVELETMPTYDYLSILLPL